MSKIFVSGDDPMYVIILAELGMIEHSTDARDGFQLTRTGRHALARLETSKNG